MSRIAESSGTDGSRFFDGEGFTRVVADARQGSLAAQGRLLEAFRHDLLAIAAANLDSDIRPKVSASDLVQETLLEAHRDFGDFCGTTWHETRAWLKRILLNNLVNHFRHWSTQKRDAGREVSLDQTGRLAAPELTASDVVSKREQQVLLERELLTLNDDHRKVLELRNRDGLSFEEIGRQMGRTSDAVRMLWYRAFDELSRKLK